MQEPTYLKVGLDTMALARVLQPPKRAIDFPHLKDSL